MSKVLYIGEIPANYGGITRKSELLEKQLKKYNEVSVINIDVKDHKIISYVISVLKLLFLLRGVDRIVYCLDNKRMLFLLKIEELFSGKRLKDTTVIISGGEFDDFLDNDSTFLKKVDEFWIEINGSIKDFQIKGFNNIVYYPNPRIQQIAYEPQAYDKKRPLKLLYYLQISKEKGLMDAVEIAKKLNGLDIKYELDFYGWVVDEVKAQFDNFIEATPNVNYKGFNDSKDIKEYFSSINNYDLMLFPTYWHGEGIAEACVEAKIAGVAIIASNHNHNQEIVDESKNEGVIVEKGYIDGYVDTIMELYNNPEKLNKLKTGSYESRKRFDISSYDELFKM